MAEYILPKFEVNVNVPAHVTFKDSKVVIGVNAKYTYGKPVKGKQKHSEQLLLESQK